MKKYIIDTDIGDDIDDAFALDLALHCGLDLIGVTTVFRNTQKRAAIAKKLISLHGRTIPVYAGRGITLDGKDERHFPVCQWTEELFEEGCFADNGEEEEAVDFLVSAARKYGEELVIVAIGPLTNVAAAIGKDAGAMRRANLCMMGGDFVRHDVEWNIFCDVTAADTVFSSGMVITAFGHEVTSKTRITPRQQEYIMAMDKTPRLAFLAHLSRLWAKTKQEGWLIVLHDVLVVRYLTDPGTVAFERAPVAVETEGKYTRGMTVNLNKYDLVPAAKAVKNAVSYAAAVDYRAFIEYFMEQIGYSAEGGKKYDNERENGSQLVSGHDARTEYDGLF